MHELLGTASGEELALEDYLEDYDQRFWRIEEHGFWKLERQQTFQEPGFGSWEAFVAGDWPEALRLIEAERAGFEEYFDRLAKQHITFRRVRVVQEPISPYLQWELHVLRLREQCGEQIRIIGADEIAAFESNGRLPELITLGSDTLYEISYSEQGIVEGAARFTDRETITTCRQFIERLYAEGQELGHYFQDAVAELDPPHVD
jgi:hypothetical protein